MSYENAPIPLSLFQDDGTYTSMHCDKSEFMHKLEELLPKPKITKINKADAVIFDAHATIQATQPLSKDEKVIFHQMANDFVETLLSKAIKVSSKQDCQVHIVFDKYVDNSIKQ